MERKPKSIVAGALASLLLALTPTLPAQDVEFGQVAEKVANLLQQEHYIDQEIDDEVSKMLLDNYLEFLDMGRLYFLQSDIDDFKSRYQTTLDNRLLMRDISPAYEIYGVYKKRVTERIEWIKNMLENEELTFDSEQTIAMTRKELPWPANAAEADRIWHKIIEGELLQEVLMRESKAEDAEKAEEEKPEGAETPNAGEEEEEDPRQVVAKRYERILDSLNENDSEDIAGFYLKSLSHSYDPHSEYFTQSEYDNFRISMRKSLTGIGALLTMTDNGYAEIRGLVVGGPAQRAGELQVADRILEVGQGLEGPMQDIMHMKLQDVVDLIRGEKGSHVRLKVIPADAADPSKTTEIVIQRDQVDLKESLARAELIETVDRAGRKTRLGWIDLPSFYSDMETGETSVTRDTERLLVRLMNENIDGLILDLRQNGGGSLEEAINLTGLFIHRGPVVQSKDSRNNIDVKLSKRRYPTYEGPLVVLTSKSSASASEILAAALQDYNRAIVVGEQSTFGKGTVQQLLPVTTGGFSLILPGASNQAGALKVTIQKFYRVAGGSTQRRGVIPDITLPALTDAMELGEAALKNPLSYDEIPQQDYALFRKEAFPMDFLRESSEKRVSKNPDFLRILDEIKRFKKRKEENSISLNKEVRKREIEQQEARKEAWREATKERYATIKEKEEDLFTTYSITLDRVNNPELRLLSEVTAEELSGMMTDAAEEKTEEEKALEPPHGYNPAKREALEVLLDFISYERKAVDNSLTATDDAKKPVRAN